MLLEQNAKGEFAAELTLENRSPYRSQMFKIKTTAPHKFRVRPTLAVLKPNAKLPVKIVLEKGLLVFYIQKNYADKKIYKN